MNAEGSILPLLTAAVALLNTLLTAWLHRRNHHEHRRLEASINGEGPAPGSKKAEPGAGPPGRRGR